MKNKAIFLDRDGTLIIDRVYLNDPEKIEYLPDVFEALRLLRDDGFRFIIATNQSGIARGLVTMTNLDKIHEVIAADFARHGIFFSGFYYAPYAVESDHFMRKPNPGMLSRGALDHRIELTQSWMIGDRMTDVEAGRRAGTRTVLLDSHETPVGSSFEPPTIQVANLLEAAEMILSRK